MVDKARWTYKIALIIILLPACAGEAPEDLQKELAGHWKLSGNSQDISGNERHALVRGDVDFEATGPDKNSGTAIGLNGLNAWLEIPADKSPQLGNGEFSIAVWINIDTNTGNVPGDILTQYDSINNKGFHLSLKTNAVTTSLANNRQLHFGIDNDQMSEWTDCGRPDSALCAFSLASYKGSLYAGVTKAGRDESGHVYRYEDLKHWVDVGSPDSSNSVMALAVFNNRLYAGTGKYRLAGSALPESENLHLGGRIFRYEGKKNWTYCGSLPDTEAIGGLIVYKGDIYATSLYSPAGFYRYDGNKTWIDCGTPEGKRVVALGVYKGYLFATSYDGGHIYRYDGISWTDCGPLGENTQTYSFAVYHGRLYVGTWPSGRVYRFEDIDRWTDVGRLGDELEVMGMLVHNGRLLAGSLPLAEVYAYEGDTVWKKLARLDHTPDVKYRRAWTMAEHDGKVYCSTLPSGKIFSFEQGRNVLCPNPIKEGWNHIVATKSKDRMSLFINGKESCQSDVFDVSSYNLDNIIPLKIGFGANSYFFGKIADLRLYNRTLNKGEIRFLSDPDNLYTL